MSWFHPVDKHLLFTKNDKADPRLGECVQTISKPELSDLEDLQSDFVILGYPDDEGISLNGGRPGAQNAPREIRTVLYKMTPHLQSPRLPTLTDLGDLIDREIPLAERHERGRQVVQTLAQSQQRWISLGGGHDYGYCDATGFAQAFPEDAVVINFDAHMDVRPTDKGFNSGTPFFRLLSEFGKTIHFAEIGLQNQCNSQAHFHWAQSQGALLFTLDAVQEQGLKPVLKNLLQGHESKKIFLSIDIDAFTSSEAPGCSQSWTTGLQAAEFLDCLKWLTQTFDIRGLGIYEVSPPLDQDNRTSKLAALIIHHFIFSTVMKDPG